MTKPLTKAQKKDKKEKRDARRSDQQKAPSTTKTTVNVPKGAPPPEAPANLCDTCAYEFGECEGVPKFASDLEEGLTGAEADRVVECRTWTNVDNFPTADQGKKEPPAPGPAAEMKAADIDYPDIVLVCAGGCGKTTEGMTFETRSGKFKQVDESGVPEWTCEECRDAAHDDGDKGPNEPGGDQGKEGGTEEEKDAAILELREEDLAVEQSNLPDRPDPKRFQDDPTDYGTCPSCERPLKRTAFNRYRDAIRCTNPRCPQYRAVVKTVGTGVV